MKTKTIKLQVQSIERLSVDINRNITMEVEVDEKDITAFLDNFSIEEVMYFGSYNEDEVKKCFEDNKND